MQRRKGDAKTKALIVIEGLKGKPVAEICTEHQLSQAQYDSVGYVTAANLQRLG